MQPELIRLFLQRVKINPDKAAFHFLQDSGKTIELTYQNLYEKSGAVARILEQRKNDSATRALLIYSPGVDFIIALFACFLSSITAIPIAIPRPRTKELFLHFLNHANPHFILTSANHETRIKKLIPDDIASNQFIITDTIPQTDEDYMPQNTANEIALIQYTSGTTTQPKGVMITFDGLAHNLRAIQQHFQLHEKSVCFSWLPHYHDMGLIDGILTPLFNDCRSILCSPSYIISNPTRWLKVINLYQVTHTGGPNFFFDLCSKRISPTIAKEFDLKSLTHVYVSAEPVRKKTLEKFAALFSASSFQLNLFTPGYGLAEATLMVTCKTPNSSLHFYVEKGQEYVGLGKPIPGMVIKILDPTTQQEISEGEVGEICLCGPSVAPGYYADKEKTSQAFVSLPTKGEIHRFLRTGDLGIMEKGELFVVGRITDTLLIRGLKYAPEDLEYIITQSHLALSASTSTVFTINQDDEEKIVVLQELKKIHDRHDLESIRNSIKDSIYQALGLTVFDIILLPEGSILKTTSGKIKRSDTRIKYMQGKFSEAL